MKLLVLDNYDSFTYNLVHVVKAIGGADLTVLRNDQLAASDALEFDKILLSPGPGIPEEAGVMPEIIKICADSKSILGVCLGHQGIAEAFGGSLTNIEQVYHGIASEIQVTDPSEVLFAGLPEKLEVGRYHSWIVNRENLPDVLKVTAETEDGTAMAIRHQALDVAGVQFHPESVLTPQGKAMIENWLKN